MGVLVLIVSGITSAQTSTRTVEFSGHTWELRRSRGLEGPGPNRFLDNGRTVWVDDSGDLHLKVWGRLGAWYAAEVVLTESLGYGTYIFETIGEIDAMDPPVILGMFTYDMHPDFAHREIDIEYGRFGSVDGPNGQFVVHPFDEPGHRLQFSADLDGLYLTHVFAWTPDEIRFASYHGHCAGEISGGSPAWGTAIPAVAEWTYEKAVPPPGDERVHLNLWLYETKAPSRDHEVVFRSFSFAPLTGE